MNTELKRALGLLPLTMIAVGSAIGSGIFLSPTEIAGYLHSPFFILLVWMVGGVITLAGALSFAEMGGMYPKAGGIYVWLKDAFGEPMAFLYGWIQLLVVTSGAIAALAVAFTTYLGVLVEMSDTTRLFVAIGAIALLTAVNLFGVRNSGAMASLFTALKLAGIALIVVAGLFLSGKVAVQVNWLAATPQTGLANAFGLALIGVLWSFGGWQHASFMAGEAKQPARTIPRAMMLGTLIVTVVYILSNIAYLKLLPVREIAAADRLAADALGRVFSWGGVFVAVTITLSTFGTIGIYTMSAPRIYYAMAADGLFFRQLAYIHPRWKTPAFAILLQSAWAIVLLLFWKKFGSLISFVSFTDYIFFLLGGISLMILRGKYPAADRPYKTWAYPLPPLLFIIIIAWFLVTVLLGKPQEAGAGLLILAMGIPAYYWFRRGKGKANGL